MPKMITGKKTQQYSTEFKFKVVEWSYQAHRSVKSAGRRQEENTGARRGCPPETPRIGASLAESTCSWLSFWICFRAGS